MYGWLPPVVSVAWIAASALLCAYRASRLARRLQESALLILGTVGVFEYAAQSEAQLIGPLIATVGFWRSEEWLACSEVRTVRATALSNSL